MTDKPTEIIWIETETLSDGSEVFNVEINIGKLAAISRDDAETMANEIAATVALYSLDDVDVMEAT